MSGPPIALPIDGALPEILDQIRRHRRLVLVAQPGAGKTTRLAPALLKAGLLAQEHPNLILLQPRRVATRSVAERIAAENHWTVGNEVGYQIRFERRIGPRTRLQVMTEGILNRKLVNDPFLEGIGAVVLDEFHERSIHTDLALALLREIRESVRDDLIVIVMSATLDAEPVATFLGDAPIVRVEGRTFPVEIRYQGSSGTPLVGRMAEAIESLLPESQGVAADILAFLPGVEEIRRTARRLDPVASRENLLVLPLHGSLPAEDQDRALRPGDRRKIVLATNIAETSLTIDGISIVIDSGLARVSSFDVERGIDRLELSRISRSSATQRAGRAGRTRPGLCVRLWSEREERGMAEFDDPEIRRIDLAATLLAVHAWGTTNPRQFSWLEAPRDDRLDAAERLLSMLGAIDSEGRITEIGHDLLRYPAPPRIALLLRYAADAGVSREGAALAALLAERDIILSANRTAPRSALKPEQHGPSDLLVRLDLMDEAEHRRFAPGLRDIGIDPFAARRVAQARDDLLRFSRNSGELQESTLVEEKLLRLLLVAFPDRVCRRRKGDPAAALMVGGQAVRLEPESVVRDGEFFLALDPRSDDRSLNRESRVKIASRIEPEWLEAYYPDAVRSEKAARFDEDRGRVVGEHRVLYRGLVIEEHEHIAVDTALAAQVLLKAIEPRALDFIREQKPAALWLARYNLLIRVMPDLSLPSVDDGLREILHEACQGRKSLDELRAAPWVSLFRAMLTYPQAKLFDELAPEALAVPSGTRIALHYEDGRPPVLAVRVQELFGWTKTPTIARGRIPVVLHLLGPNYRPVQVTDDLRSFWTTTYFQVRKDLRNRYPKHSWPEDPLTAIAEARGSRHRS